MERTLEQIQLALDRTTLQHIKGIELLCTDESVIMTDKEFYRVFTRNKNGYWECWGIDYDHEDIQCLDDLKRFFYTNEKYFANCDREQNPYYDISHIVN